MEKILKTLILWLCCLSRAFATSTLDVDQLAQRYIPSAYVGVVVMDAKNGQVLYSQNANKDFSPASTTKVLAAFAALVQLGPNYTYKTQALIDVTQLKNHILHGDLTMQFNGDPSLTSKDVEELVKMLPSAGIQEIDGNIIIDNTRFQGSPYPFGIEYEDVNWYYNAPATSIIIDQNKATIHLVPAHKIGQKTTIKFKQNTQYMTWNNQVMTVSEKQAAHHCQLILEVSDKNQVHLSGCWPIHGAVLELNLAIKNPTLFAQKIIQENLAKYKIKFNGHFVTGKTPKLATLQVAYHESAPISKLIKTMLKDSNNLYARILGKTLGEQIFHSSSIQEGANAIKKILFEHFNIKLNGSKIYDTAGTGYTLLTPMQMAQTLYAAYHSPYKTVLIDALPKSGWLTDGTFEQDYIYKKYLPPHVYAKTGSMKSISTLAGYITTKKGKTLIFTIYTNHVAEQLKYARKMQTRICKELQEMY